MSIRHSHNVVLFKSVNQTMWGDKILKENGIVHKLVPVPRHISSDCGVCLRFLREQKDSIVNALESSVPADEIRELAP